MLNTCREISNKTFFGGNKFLADRFFIKRRKKRPTQNFGILPPESDDTLWLKLEGDVDFVQIVCPNYVDTSDFWVLWHLVALT